MQRSALVGLILLSAARVAVGQPLDVAERPGAAKSVSYSAVGWASWYGREFHGRRTADGETFDMGGLTAAHKTMPLPCYARVTNLGNGRSIVVRVNDRGPYVGQRLIDVSARVANLLDFQRSGLTKVKVEYVGVAPARGGDEPTLLASLKTRDSHDDEVTAFAPTSPARDAFAQSAALAAANRAANGLEPTASLEAPPPRDDPPPSPYGGLAASFYGDSGAPAAANKPTRTAILDSPPRGDPPLSPYGRLAPSPYGDLAPWPAEPPAAASLMAEMRP